MLYAALYSLDFLFAILLVPVWGAAAIMVGRLPGARTDRVTRRRVTISTVLIGLGVLFAAGRVAMVAGLGAMSWLFVSDRKIVTAAVIALAAAVVAVVVPGRLRAVRRGEGSPTEPWLVAPVQLALLAALPSLFEKFLPPYRDALLNLAGIVVVLGLLGWLRVALIRRRHASGRAPSRRQWVVRLAVVLAVALLVGTLSVVGSLTSHQPESFSMMQGEPDFGGGAPFVHNGHFSAGHGAGLGQGGAISVDQLKGPLTGVPDKRFTLTAEQKTVRFPSGATFEAWTFNGQVPGPELRVREGDLVEVTLVNHLPSASVTIHWHGVDVPNGEDGVAGVTQDAVAPGKSYVYRFRAGEVGTRWYHSHEQATEQVNRGLFGPLVIEPKAGTGVTTDLPVVLHDFSIDGSNPIPAVGDSDTLAHKQIGPGSTVRLRVVNSTMLTKQVALTGVPYRVTAFDGTGVNQPGELRNGRVSIGGSSSYDLEFTMPNSPVRLVDVEHPDAGVAYSPDGRGEVAADVSGPELDPLRYGAPSATPFDANSHFDRQFTLTFDVWLGFYNGAFVLRQTVNGKVFPDAPMHMVREGELIKMTLINRGEEAHPIHLHGHHFLVLDRNGERPAGSPIWLDTVNVLPGDSYQIGFRADNPGIWMDHCHNFKHADLGMVLHLAYENVTSPYQIGGAANNHPE